MRKLQALGGMQGHQDYAVAALVLILAFQDIHQGEAIEHLCERLAAGLVILQPVEPGNEVFDVLPAAPAGGVARARSIEPVTVIEVIEQSARSSEHRRSPAYSASLSSVVVPISRRGALIIRRNARSSSGLASRRR